VDGLIDHKSSGPNPKLTAEQRATLREIVAAKPDPAKDGYSRAFSVLVDSKPGSKSLFGRVFEVDNRVHLS